MQRLETLSSEIQAQTHSPVFMLITGITIVNTENSLDFVNLYDTLSKFAIGSWQTLESASASPNVLK